ncbi:Uncharacterized protein DBV15_00245 [Temnothorax longispinosus]|uniref:Chitin-binding type-2 domain-containing protein n=1 Tax=Temnothorax longispinosus TaxID=300112 RepID=A0A4S2KI57_9HYME|nr:Uncharacterized protein DBV15_00245 [Temnothorax longispinosus]
MEYVKTEEHLYAIPSHLICDKIIFERTRNIQHSGTAYVSPYPGDCSKYEQCDSSGCFVMSCGRGTEFNPAIGTCDYPLRDRTGCTNRG